MCNELLEKYEDVDLINAYDYNIKACTDCGFCSKHACECIYCDMDEIYKLIEEAANIIIVSPIHVGSVSAPLLAMFSRLQIYFANKFILKNNYPFAKKQGFGIIVSGKDWDGQRSGAKVVLKHALLEMNANFNYYCYLTNTDSKGDYSSQLNGFYQEVDKYVRG
ncbi:MAG: flavodoxin family protein [Bacilli bacterium]